MPLGLIGFVRVSWPLVPSWDARYGLLKRTQFFGRHFQTTNRQFDV